MNATPPINSVPGLAADYRLTRLVRARALAARARGWPALPADAATALLDSMAARFDDGPDQLDKAETGGFYARLGLDDDLTERFVSQVAAERVPASLVPGGPIVDLARVFRRSPFSALAAIARRLGVAPAQVRAALAALAAGTIVVSPVAGPALRATGFEPAPGDAAAPAVLVAAAELAGADPATPTILFQLIGLPDGLWQVLLALRGPDGGLVAAGWAISADLDGQPVALNPEEPGLWTLAAPLSSAAVTALTVHLTPLGPAP